MPSAVLTIAIILLIVVIVASWAWIHLPRKWAKDAGLKSPRERLQAEIEYRSALARAYASPTVAVTILGAIVTSIQGIQTYRDSQERQFLKSYQGALKTLGKVGPNDEPDKLRAAYSIGLLVREDRARSVLFLFPVLSALRQQAKLSPEAAQSNADVSLQGPDLTTQALFTILATALGESRLTEPLDLNLLNLSNLSAIHAPLSYSRLIKTKLTDANLTYANLAGTDLYQANLMGADLTDSNLEGANLIQTDFRFAFLTRAQMGPGENKAVPAWRIGGPVRLEAGAHTAFWHAHMNGADLHCADLPEGEFFDASLRNADVSATDLHGTHFEGANLQGANISWANARGAIFRGADLRSANLQGANLSGADLTDVKLDPHTSFKDACGQSINGPELPECPHEYRPHEDIRRGCPEQ